MDITTLSLIDTQKGLLAKSFSAKELISSYLQKAKAATHLNAFTEITESAALAQAQKSDELLAKGQARPLEGIPIAVKDIFCTKGVKTTASSKILHNFVPPYESQATSKLWENGAIMLGKTGMDEFAMGSSNTTSYQGNVISPWKGKNGEDLVPGGSSGGSAAAVSAGLCPVALGTDTGGSIRQPAAFCGIVGVKPTYGRVSRRGIVAFASSLDQAGVLTRSTEDAAIALRHMCGYDPQDSTSSAEAVPDWISSINKGIKGMKVGIPREYKIPGINAEIVAMWEKGAKWLESEGAEIVEISLPHTEYALPVYYIVAPAEASSNLARYDGVRYGYREESAHTSLDEMYGMTRSKGFGDEVKRRIMLGTYVLSAGYYDAYFLKAQKVRQLIAQDFRNAFTKVDAILTPTAPSAAFAIGEKIEDPVLMYLNDIFTVPTSLAGLPAISVPSALNMDGLPLGLQVISKHFDEDAVFRAARVLEQHANFGSEA